MSDIPSAKCVIQAIEVIERLQAHIEELEEAVSVSSAGIRQYQMLGLPRLEDHIITDEQIDAAVETIHNIITHEDSTVTGEQLVWNALNKLNIHRCETCPWHRPVPDACPNCNDHEWVIRDA